MSQIIVVLGNYDKFTMKARAI